MTRQEAFTEFLQKYDNVTYNGTNIPKVLENLTRADANGCLRQFFMNQKPYISAFPFMVMNGATWAARGKDQVALVIALNIYGANHPGFAARLNALLKQLAVGNNKEAQSVMVLMAAQMELQKLEISLINFADWDLLQKVNASIRRMKGPGIALGVLCIVGGAIGMPGFTIAGLIPLTFVAIAAFIYGFMKLPYWLGAPVFSEEIIRLSGRPVGECVQGM